MSKDYYIKYKNGTGKELESEYDDPEFFDAAKKYITDQFGNNAISETRSPVGDGKITLLNE